MVTNQLNKPNLAINRLSVGVEDRKKWASSEKRARAAKERVSEERREEKSAHSIFLSYFLPMLSPLSWSLEQAKPNTDLNSLRMLINHPRAAHAPPTRARGAPLLHVYDKKYDCFVKQMYRLSWFLSVFCCYAFWSAERYHAIFLSNQTQNQDQSSLISAAFSAFEFYFTNIPRTTVLLLIK